MDAKLRDEVSRFEDFFTWSDADKIRFFGWFQHAIAGKTRFTTGDIGKCYAEFSLEKPNISQYLINMEKRQPKELLRDSGGYYLEGSFRAQCEEKYGQRETTVKIVQALLDLPGKIPDVAEREFLDEVLICFKRKAFRASIVMCWSLAYFHFCHWILKHHLAAFNAQYPIRFTRFHAAASIPVITKYEDFSADLKESQVIAIAKSANIITNDQFKILDVKLGRRNSAAHPSSTVHFDQLQAEEFVYDLVTNIVLALPL
jgi:hypothetical protein